MAFMNIDIDYPYKLYRVLRYLNRYVDYVEIRETKKGYHVFTDIWCDYENMIWCYAIRRHIDDRNRIHNDFIRYIQYEVFNKEMRIFEIKVRNGDTMLEEKTKYRVRVKIEDFLRNGTLPL